ncbi:MAG: signal peptidase I [Candidatus Hydrothermota bacterium]|nr:MAG: signal peptidase I [Candidatus Hydrothermae bacterium]
MKDSKFRNRVLAEIRSWAVVIFVVILLRTFVVAAYHIPSSSMEDTLLVGDFLLAFKPVYGIHIPFTDKVILRMKKPHRGEIVIFSSPLEERRDLVKRCIALPGDTVQIINKVVYINGKPLDEPYAVHKDPRIFPPKFKVETEAEIKQFEQLWLSGEFRKSEIRDFVRDNFGPVVVPDGTVFVMGDNRDFSFDSRFFGPLELKKLKAMPLIIYFSWNPWRPLWPIWKKIRWHRIFKIIATA